MLMQVEGEEENLRNANGYQNTPSNISTKDTEGLLIIYPSY